ncbi:hypothetical protein M9H77_03565 [Catharanthus roseus]|uniref:Uncharacterized protein n=1 Tax=Catharanthus roseus TaxID=4058 RepID=A0ACC0CBT4_CATRO|nr:hypothetical protein M9H77_03565 [Catharanthus roseus]
MTEYITAVTQMVSNEPSMLYPTVDDDDDENDHSDEEYVVSSESESDGNNDTEEEELQTSVNLAMLSSARYDYTKSGTFLEIAAGSLIDDLIESGTLRLLDWIDSMTDIQLGIRFVDKVQAITRARKWSIRTGREYRVVKNRSDHWTANFTITVTLITVHGTSA